LYVGRPNGRSHRVGLEFSLFLSLFQDKERKENQHQSKKENEEIKFTGTPQATDLIFLIEEKGKKKTNYFLNYLCCS
jgi:hypothetical protein